MSTIARPAPSLLFHMKREKASTAANPPCWL